MPVLRLEPDNSLGETLGNLGSALGNALNPLNRMRAYQLQQRMLLEQQQLQQMQRVQQAQQAAVQQFGRLLPPDKLPWVANLIYQNTPPDQVAKQAAIWSGRMVDDPSPAGTKNNIDVMRQFGVQWDQPYAPEVGPKTIQARQNFEAQGAGKTTKAQEQSKVDVQTQNAPAIAQAEGLKAGSVEQAQQMAKQIAITALQNQMIDDPAEDAHNRGLQATIHALGGGDAPTPGVIVDAGPNTRAIRNQQITTQESTKAGEVQRATEVGKLVGGGIPTNNQTFFPFGLPGSKGNPFPTPGGSPPALTPETTQPNVSITDPSRPWATAVPVVRGGPDGSAITGTSPGEQTQAGVVDKATHDMLQEAVDAGVSAKKLKVTTARIRTLAELANANGPGQISSAIAKKLNDMNLSFTDQSQLLAEMDSLYKSQIPELRKDMGVKFEAGPELSAQSKMVGVSTLPLNVVRGILARQDTIADLGIQRRDLAQRALNQAGAPLSMPDYYAEENKLYDQLPQNEVEMLKLYGANAPHAPVNPAPPIPTTQGGAPQTPDFPTTVGNIWHSLFGGGQPAPAPGPPNEIIQLPDGTWGPKPQ